MPGGDAPMMRIHALVAQKERELIGEAPGPRRLWPSPVAPARAGTGATGRPCGR
jgi:hypothetical protein